MLHFTLQIMHKFRFRLSRGLEQKFNFPSLPPYRRRRRQENVSKLKVAGFELGFN